MRLIGLEHLRTFHVKLSINYIWHRVKFVIAPSEFDELQYYIGNTRTVPNNNDKPLYLVLCENHNGLKSKNYRTSAILLSYNYRFDVENE